MIPTHERRMLHRDPAQRIPEPLEMKLGDEVIFRGKTWKVHDFLFIDQLFVLKRGMTMIEVHIQDLV